MSREWTEMEIAAYVDGELVGEDAARVARVIETDPEAARIALKLMEMNDLLREAFAGPAEEEAPAPLRAAVLAEPGKVATLKRKPFRASPAVFSALAATVALTVGLGLGGALFGTGAPEGARLALGAGPAPAEAAAAFETAASGTEVAGLRPLVSFETAAGPCREFEALGEGGAVAAMGLACREDGAWSVRVLAAAPEAETASGGFAPASGAAADAVGALLDALGAGPALSPAEEAARIDAGWR